MCDRYVSIVSLLMKNALLSSWALCAKELKDHCSSLRVDLFSLVPRPRGKKRVAWYPLFAHVRPFPEKPGNPRMFGNGPYN